MRILLKGFLLCLALIIVGCGSQKEDDYKYKIGFVISTLNNPFFVKLKNGAEDIAKENSVKLMVLDSRNDPIKEQNNVESLLVSGVDLIIINPTDSDAVVKSIELANNKNIPVITVDRKATSGKVVCHIASDNYKGGAMAAEYIIDLLNGNGDVIELQGIPGTSAARERGKGFNERIKYSDVKVVARQPANFDRREALVVMENLLQRYSNIDAVFAHNDEMALGAIKAIEEANKDIYVVGFDGTEDALLAIKNGRLTATIAQQPSRMGRLAVENAIKYLNGEKLPKNIKVDLLLIK